MCQFRTALDGYVIQATCSKSFILMYHIQALLLCTILCFCLNSELQAYLQYIKLPCNSATPRPFYWNCLLLVRPIQLGLRTYIKQIYIQNLEKKNKGNYRGDMILLHVYNFPCNKYDIDYSDFFTFSPITHTRGHTFKLFKPFPS